MVKEKIIVCENVSYRYETVNDEEQAKAVKDVSFSVDRGSFVAILGRNGSGKSTLAKLLNGVLLPQTGRVLADGLDTADEDKIQTIRKKFGMVFQNPDNQLVSNLVEEDVAFGPENLGLPSEEIRKRVDQALKIVGMESYAGHSPHKLSGGQKQRIAIAGVLAMMPECIIFDESTAMLDPHGRREIMETILKLNREKKLTVILITHHMDEAVQADRVVVMENGKIVRDGTPREVFSDVPFLHAAGLDAPQATEIVHLISEDAYFQNKTTFPKGILTEEEAAEFIIGLFGKR